ncbi:type II secretion system F family protein [Actinomadura sp. 3N407]|uniref:type II secretion system F family protein n=1 Tax=Actinomadura sp. 3N407 TaxID=3457423 RepID=UPI003FCE760D
MTTLLALLGGAGAGGGVLLIYAGLFGSAVTSARPPSRFAAALTRLLTLPDQRRHRFAAVGALGSGGGVLLLTRWPAAAIAAAVAAVWLPRAMSGRAAARQLVRLDAIEQWVRKLSGLLGASHGLEDALQTSVRHAPAAIDAEVSALAARLRAGVSTQEALYRLADDLDDPVGDLVTGALLQASQVRGGGVQRLLNDLASLVADDVAGRREVEASRAPHRTTVRGLAVIFILFGVALMLRPDYSAPYGTVLGQAVLAVILSICGTGLWVMHRLANQPPVARFLTRTPATPSSAVPDGQAPGGGGIDIGVQGR